ncbi:sugar transporter [Rhodobacter sp. NSM]|uniref:sugar transporter n=1 Tax=Rhodobacter sp. NSM TaxID=3457501 RepID=UPI003FCF0744
MNVSKPTAPRAAASDEPSSPSSATSGVAHPGGSATPRRAGQPTFRGVEDGAVADVDNSGVASPNLPSQATVRRKMNAPSERPQKNARETKANLHVPSVVPAATARLRHRGILASFILMVVAPTLAATFYLFAIAEDQFASTVGFAVRSEDAASPLDFLSGFGGLSGAPSSGTASDTDILYQFIQSQALVQKINDRANLKAIYSKPTFDPVFSFSSEGEIEDLVEYWKRMVRISYDSTTGLIELRVHAFEPRDAQILAQLILDESTQMINDLSAIARADATKYAQEELEKAVERLRERRVAVTEFRSRTQIVDPSADIQGQMGLLFSLQEQLAAANIDINLLRQTTQPSDPRIAQNERRIAVIEELIERERRKFGLGGSRGGEEGGYSSLVGEYERLTVDREFAEKAYLAALANYDSAIADAQRRTRYLAAYIRPTLATTSLYPQRGLLSLLTAGFTLLLWSISLLIYYSVRDRR